MAVLKRVVEQSYIDSIFISKFQYLFQYTNKSNNNLYKKITGDKDKV